MFGNASIPREIARWPLEAQGAGAVKILFVQQRYSCSSQFKLKLLSGWGSNLPKEEMQDLWIMKKQGNDRQEKIWAHRSWDNLHSHIFFQIFYSRLLETCQWRGQKIFLTVFWLNFIQSDSALQTISALKDQQFLTLSH